MQIIKNKKGFTLIETLIYVGIISLLASVFISFGILVYELRAKSEAIGEININGKSALSLISEKIRSAESISSPGIGATSTVLILNMPDSSVSSITLIDNVLILTEGGRQLNITNTNVIISNLEFLYIFSGSESGTVNFSFNIAYNSEIENYQKNIISAVSLKR